MKHVCHATECNVEVPPRLLMCAKHWAMVPNQIQRGIWAAYRMGQEYDKKPSPEYMVVYHQAVNAVDEKEGRKPTFMT